MQGGSLSLYRFVLSSNVHPRAATGHAHTGSASTSLPAVVGSSARDHSTTASDDRGRKLGALLLFYPLCRLWSLPLSPFACSVRVVWGVGCSRLVAATVALRLTPLRGPADGTWSAARHERTRRRAREVSEREGGDGRACSTRMHLSGLVVGGVVGSAAVGELARPGAVATAATRDRLPAAAGGSAAPSQSATHPETRRCRRSFTVTLVRHSSSACGGWTTILESPMRRPAIRFLRRLGATSTQRQLILRLRMRRQTSGDEHGDCARAECEARRVGALLGSGTT